MDAIQEAQILPNAGGASNCQLPNQGDELIRGTYYGSRRGKGTNLYTRI